ncbi:DUF6693 family protein [Roseinatronobacter alkalisoli]|uniref:DUF898 family protein n=1 Tax=Roseinatronobacter alkalisoli TaxID=3028235 RepID=A0ABT5T903_9RHOB|nr:DUF6693 family protein [Roseinatronobacter sp. HJB301]MDD7971610.1 hypothetical protein [Roseinatronobacter sp. HJB301]
MQGQTYSCEYSVGEALGQLVIWVLLTILTLGLALFVLPYYFLKAPINRTYVLDSAGRKIGQLSVEVGFTDILGHALLWLILTILTLGFAYLIYWQSVMKRLMNATRTVPL